MERPRYTLTGGYQVEGCSALLEPDELRHVAYPLHIPGTREIAMAGEEPMTRVTRDGRVTLPASILREANVEEGDVLSVRLENGKAPVRALFA